jgi:HlyD family secretion protein
VQNVVTYDVVISVPNPDRLLKPGMTATLRITVDKRDDVLRIPNQALRYTPGGLQAATGAAAHDQIGTRLQAWVLRDGRPVAVPLKVGLDDDTHTEIVQSELKVGDEVVTSEQTSGGSASSRLPFFRL